MAEEFFKFPRTPHLFGSHGASDRTDRTLDAADTASLLNGPVCVEEKIDGANLGLSLGPDHRVRAQSRGHFLENKTGGQWKPLWSWIAHRVDSLTQALGPHLVLFGEWCYAQHSVHYDALPDWFLAFDVYDRRASRFWSVERRNELLRKLNIATVPHIARGTFNVRPLTGLLGRSRVGSGLAEGLYVRRDEGDWLLARGKLVRPGWLLADDAHWSARPLRANELQRTSEPAR